MNEREPWSDQRLAEAFVEHAAEGKEPADLATTTVEAIRVRPAQGSRPTLRLLLPLAAAVIVAVAVLGPNMMPNIVGPESSPSSPTVVAAPTASTRPTGPFGLPLLTMAEAIAIRDNGVDAREFVVEGWIGRRTIGRCAATPDGPPDSVLLGPDCAGGDRLYATEDGVPGPTLIPGSPQPMAIDGFLDGVDQSWRPTGSGASRVIVIGHFDDRRSTDCRIDVQQQCRDKFVVDRVESADGAPVSDVATESLDPATLPDDQPAADIAVAQAVPDGRIISTLAVGRGRIAFVEPSLAGRDDGIIDASLVWRFQALRGQQVSTYLVADGTTDVVAVADDGSTVLVIPPPDATPSPVPADGLPEVTVAELIERAAGLPSDEEVIVRGWLVRSSALVDCDADPSPPPLVPDCAENLLWLMDEPDSQGRGGSPPNGSIVPMLRPDAHIGVAVMPGSMVEVVAVGHQGDHRWTSCVDVDLAPCFDRFVIDRLLPAGAVVDAPKSPWAYHDDVVGIAPKRDIDEVVDVLLDVTDLRRVVSIGLVRSGTDLRQIEPILAGEARDDVAPLGEDVWMVRAITADSNGAAWTYLVSDDPTTEPGVAFLVTETGVSRLDGSALRFTVPLGHGLGGEASRVVVIDRSLLLVAAGRPDEGTATRISQQNLGNASGSFYMGDPSIPGRLYLGVEGGMCDRLSLTVNAEATSVSIDRGPPPGMCRMALMNRVIQLDFADPTVVDRLATTWLTTPPQPSSGPPWPPEGARSVTLSSPVAAGRPLVQVAIVDLSGRLATVEEATLERIPAGVGPDGGSRDGLATDPSSWLAADPSSSRRAYLVWIGSICDTRATVTIAADLSSIAIVSGPRPACDGMAIGRGLILTFAGPVDVSVTTVTSLTIYRGE